MAQLCSLYFQGPTGRPVDPTASIFQTEAVTTAEDKWSAVCSESSRGSNLSTTFETSVRFRVPRLPEAPLALV